MKILVINNLLEEKHKDRNVEMFLEDLQNFVAGKPLNYLVNKKLGY